MSALNHANGVARWWTGTGQSVAGSRGVLSSGDLEISHLLDYDYDDEHEHEHEKVETKYAKTG
jgi:hypothetical protein